ncbi:poly [Culex quinquefasciatus]|uniref:Poly n=1 Tax=Culex quinquefasciatus TaxID=7176 RepID=B0WUX9_CULQU|nr:poly [Culex quinquefasciatus]|eukprot:XP_001859919.1 poly [Culex quinquefasciatus]
MVTGSRTNEIVLATELNKDKLKKMRCSLIDIFHRKRWGSDSSDVQIYQLLETMFNASIRRRSKFGYFWIKSQATGSTPPPQTSARRSGTTSRQQSHAAHPAGPRPEVNWNQSHPDHSVLAKRDEAFDEVSCELGMSMPELKHHWRTHGGKMATKINNTIAAVISNPVEVERMGSRMQEVEQEDYIEDGKAGGVISCITSKSICNWGCDPYSRIPQDEVKSKSKKSIHQIRLVEGDAEGAVRGLSRLRAGRSRARLKAGQEFALFKGTIIVASWTFGPYARPVASRSKGLLTRDAKFGFGNGCWQFQDGKVEQETEGLCGHQAANRSR